MAKVGFLELPAEIRDRIYKFLFVQYPAVNPRPDTGGPEDGPYNRNSNSLMCRLNDSVCPWLSPRGLNRKYENAMLAEEPWDRPVKEDDIPIPEILALLATCRQIFQEAGDMFFKMNTFSFDSPRLMKHAICSLSFNRLALLTSVETQITIEAHRHATFHKQFRDLECLRDVPNLKFLYLSIAVKCTRQGRVKSLLESLIPDLNQPELEIVVEETDCFHCERNRLRMSQGFTHEDLCHVYHQAWMERQWWLWRRNSHSKERGFQVIQRFGAEEIDLIGEQYRGRAKDARWKTRYDEDSEQYTDCLVDRQHCVSCGMNGAYLSEGLARCPTCRLAGYCSRGCMDEDFPSHSLSCVLIPIAELTE